MPATEHVENQRQKKLTMAIKFIHLSLFLLAMCLCYIDASAYLHQKRDIFRNKFPVQPKYYTKCATGCVCLFSASTMFCANRVLETMPNFSNASDKIKLVHLSGNNLKYIKANSFLGFSNVKQLYLQNNEISHIEPGAFNHMPNLSELYLSGNRIDCSNSTCDDIFQGMENLRVLEFDDNVLKTVTEHMLQDLRKLNTLVLSRNKIEKVEAEAFRQLPSLTHLYLSNNKLETLPSVFKGANALELLDLENNTITNIEASDFAGLSSLQSLTISYNPIKDLHKDSLKGLNNLRRLNMAGLDITSIDEDLFDGLPNLETLYINDNSLKPSDFLPAIRGKLPRLKELDMSRTYARELEPKSLTKIPSLDTLRISEMPRLVCIKSKALWNLTSLQVLKITDNRRLVTIEENALAFPASQENVTLTEVWLTRNYLYTLPVRLPCLLTSCFVFSSVAL